jgi:hypothetical protein
MRNVKTEVENVINGRLIRAMLVVLGVRRTAQRRGSRRFNLVCGGLVVLLGMIAAPSAFAQATVMGPFTDTFLDTNPCTGESFSGTSKTFMLVYTKFGLNSIHFTFRTMSHAEALTTMTAVKYVANVENTQEADVAFGGALEGTQAFSTVFVRQGDTATTDIPTSTGDDFVSSLVSHITINANGVITVDFSRGTPKCTH